jgi:hypothetical protein
VRCLLVIISLSLAAAAQQPVSFNRDIRPIMSDTCFRCHGPDASSRMANLRLDIRDEALKPNRRGQAPIVAGNPDASLIVQRIFHENAALRMPPESAHKTLSTSQKETIRRWVAEGAKYEGHWAWEPIRRTPGATIDSLLAAELAKHSLKPSPEADRRTLIRRAALDLNGIPPTPAEVEAFVNDASPNAYEKLIDRLLASPRYAEKQALHWLDAVRYADTAGYHGDNPFPAWPYRDWVLSAFHNNMPFDEFVRQQLAGDLMPKPTPEKLTATAYNRILRVSAEGGLQPKEYIAKYASDRVRTTAAVFLGGTLGCAECHDHKFDPFTARDFYSFKAFFADIKETGLVPDRGPKAWGSQLDLPDEQQKARREAAEKALEAAAKSLDAARPPMTQTWAAQLLADHKAGKLQWTTQRPVAASATGGAQLTIYNDQHIVSNYDLGASLRTDNAPGNGLIVASGPNPDNATYTVTLQPGAGTWMQLGLQAVQDDSLPGIRVARGADRLMVTEIEATLEPGGRKLSFTAAMTLTKFLALDQHPSNIFDGDPNTGWGASPYNDHLHPFLALRFAEPVATTANSKIIVTLRHDSVHRRATLGRFRLALSPGPSMPFADTPGQRQIQITSGLSAQAQAVLKKPAEEYNKEEYALAADLQAWTNPQLLPLHAAAQKRAAALTAVEQTIPRVMIAESVPPAEPTRILRRGNFLDEDGEIVSPAIPAFLGKLDSPTPTRLDLANWLVSKDTPLAARAHVNRIWRQFFGTGLSKVLDDLGSQGEWPTHPELLDHLAGSFIDSNWDMKALVKSIVMSRAYRQTSDSTPQIDEKDPDNRLLARQSRFRVDAEIVRDIALSVSGLLHEQLGGPSVRPLQPDGYLAALNYPKRDYSASRGPDLYRRGIYTFWQRTFLHPSLTTFDAASREECTVNRTTSNTPLQSLVLLNDPTFVEAARVFAQNTIAAAKTTKDRAAWAFTRAAGRAPTEAELTLLTGLHANNLRRYDADPKAARALASVGEAPRPAGVSDTELASWTAVTRAILNLHSTITRN